MSQKDWILLLVPVFCNGVVIFILQKIFEKRQMAITSKQKYVSILQEKIDIILKNIVDTYNKAANDLDVSDSLASAMISLNNMHLYYLENSTLFKSIKHETGQTMKIYAELKNAIDTYNESGKLESVLHKISVLIPKLEKLLQKIKAKCVTYNV